MSTDTAAPPDLAAPVDEAPFFISQEYISSCLNLVLRRGTSYGGTPIRKIQLGEGNDFTVSQGDGVKFVDGRYVARNQDEVDWLDSHESAGILFHKVGFGADGQTADNSAELISDVIALAFRGDYQKISDILIAERNGHRRPDVIAACERTLNELTTPAPDAAEAATTFQTPNSV